MAVILNVLCLVEYARTPGRGACKREPWERAGASYRWKVRKLLPRGIRVSIGSNGRKIGYLRRCFFVPYRVEVSK